MEISLYQLAVSAEQSPKPFALSSATFLAMIKSTIDLLIEQEIAASVWVKLPPGEIWLSEIQRYQEQVGVSGSVYTCQMDEGKEKAENISQSHIVQLISSNQLRREYFLLVLSPQFQSVIVAHRPLKRSKTQVEEQAKDKKNPSLLAITAFDGDVIQRLINGITQVIVPESPVTPADFNYPMVTEPTLINQLLVKQLQRQDEIYRQITRERLTKVQQQNQELLNTLQVKDEFLSNLCQELRAPLTHMKTALSLLNSPNLKPPQRQRYLQLLNTECDQQNSLINGLLELAQINRNFDTATLELVQINDIVPGVVSTYQPLAQEKGIMLAYTIPADLPPVYCVTSSFKQIVINLLHNSIKFTPISGQVWVRSRCQKNYVELEFTDTGIGIPETEITKIFDRFYRVRPATIEENSGAGLGLTIVKELLQHCRGSISVKSKLGEGSTFIVQLPIAPQKSGVAQ